MLFAAGTGIRFVMFETMHVLAGWCGAVPLGGSIVLGLFLAGAAGSAMHCVTMCGGFVLGQVADRMAQLPAARLCEWQRLSAGVLWPYHLGRLTTYGTLGALAGAGGAVLSRLPWFGWLAASLLLVAAGLFLAHALRRLLPWVPGIELAPPFASRLVGRLTRGLSRRGRASGYLLGVALGFLPCGFLYGALAAAAGSASPLTGSAGMLAFGLGTVPALVAVGVAGQAAGHRFRGAVAAMAPAVLLLNAALLAAMAVRTLA